MNNVIVFETTLTKDEYNGFGTTSADFFTITEVALVGAREVNSTGATPIDPRNIFLNGSAGTTELPYQAAASGTATVTLDTSENPLEITEGDRIKLVNTDGSAITDLVNPYFLVMSKAVGGRDLVLDRTPVTTDNSNNDLPIAGAVGVLRDGFKIFSHRILRSPVKKSADFTITARWRIAFN